ncbi:MAG TPA: RNA 3'-terminal phosphate cyclase [Methanocella sp.]|nr:RNA 3'-terminal phosphate cyclase [Methanocella sp.]
MDLATIDGSIGEGGGQVLRTAIALSAILQKGVRIANIRKGRPRPGLGIQHVKSMEIAREMTGARATGIYPGSTEVVFIPGPIRAGDYTIRMGTAGSITLALQSILPISAYAPGPIALDITGGTDVKWSPTYDYFENVTVPALALFGFSVESRLISRGYFPAGNGRAVVRTSPAMLHGVNLTEPAGDRIRGISSTSKLPSHVAWRQAKAANDYLRSRGYGDGDVRLDVRNDASTGSGITLFRGHTGGSALGERGKPAERVGQEAAAHLVEELKAGAAVDAHLADQLIIFMALADGPSSITVRHVTGHTSAGMLVARQMLGRDFEVLEKKVTLIRSLNTRAECGPTGTLAPRR